MKSIVSSLSPASLSPGAIRLRTSHISPAAGLLGLSAALQLACGAQSDETFMTGLGSGVSVGVADLALVQEVDRHDIVDGDAVAFRQADQSAKLVHGRRASSNVASTRLGACNDDPRVALGLVSLDTCIGADLFFRESFGGNGRTCSSCHPVTNNFTIDPNFIAKLAADDPLFVAEQNPELAQLERPDLMRKFGLILVNPDGTDQPTEKFVMRSVPHTWSLATSLRPGPFIASAGTAPDGSTIPPIQRTGWGGDGAPGEGSLRDFATGAVTQHATLSLQRRPYEDFLLPTATQLAQIEHFQLELGRLNDVNMETVQLTDPGAERGRNDHLDGPARICDNCHRDAGANNLDTRSEFLTVNSNFDIGTERHRIAELDEQGIPRDGGFGRAPFDSDGDGVNDALGDGKFNSMPLIEAADTGPYFHGNQEQTLEDAIAFYASDIFNASPVGQVLGDIVQGKFRMPPEEVADLGRFLRVLNASFNCQLALPRLQASFQITGAFGNKFISIQRGLLELARVEVDDALRVLGEVSALNLEQQDQLRVARAEIGEALRSLRKTGREEHTRAALVKVADANAGLGTGITFRMGDGVLMF